MATREQIMEMGFFHKWRIFSNFHLCPIIVFGKQFQSTEAAFMSQKDLSRVDEFVNLSPISARRLGQSVLLRPDWEQVKLSVMEEANRAKYLLGSYEHYALVNTGQKPLVEYNWWHDNYWGDCLCPRCEKIEGKNALGNILMQIRREV